MGSGLAIHYFAARSGYLVCLVHLVEKRTKPEKLDKLPKITGRARPNHSAFTI